MTLDDPKLLPLCSDHRFSSLISLIRQRAEIGSITLHELLEVFGPKGHVFIIVFLTIPFIQPIPLPGISSAFGLTIGLVGFFMAIDRPPWIPARFGRIKLDSKTLIRFCTGVEYLILKLEKIVKPRGRPLFAKLWFQQVNGALLLFHGLVLSLPLPIPFSNFLPALVLLLIALGSLEEDFFVVCTGYFFTLVNAAFFVALIVIPYLSYKAATS